MGVTRRSEPIRPISVEEELNNIIDRFHYADINLSDSELSRADQNVELSHAPAISRSRKNKERRAMKKLQRYLDLESGGNAKNSMGGRRKRRLENAQILMSFADKDDICSDFSDMVPKTLTAFEKLFLSQEKMQIWNDFIELDEEEQQQILEDANYQIVRGWYVVGAKSVACRGLSKFEEKHKHHPTYCGRACFERLDGRNKRLLTAKRLPWNFIDRLEEELRSFFCESTSSKHYVGDGPAYVGIFENSLERAIGHAVAQFLMLKSKSVSVRRGGKRLTEFRNPRQFFSPPHIRLVQYLSSIRVKPIEFCPYSQLRSITGNQFGHDCSQTDIELES